METNEHQACGRGPIDGTYPIPGKREQTNGYDIVAADAVVGA